MNTAEAACCCPKATIEPIKFKMNTNNINEFLYNSDYRFIHRELKTVYASGSDIKMKLPDHSWTKGIIYNPLYRYNEYFVRSVDSFIENFVPCIFEDWEFRLLGELDDINDKITKLSNFINNNDNIDNIDKKERIIMGFQLINMREYANNLKSRINIIIDRKIKEYDSLPTGE